MALRRSLDHYESFRTAIDDVAILHIYIAVRFFYAGISSLLLLFLVTCYHNHRRLTVEKEKGSTGKQIKNWHYRKKNLNDRNFSEIKLAKCNVTKKL